jgi:hypothetical protein
MIRCVRRGGGGGGGGGGGITMTMTLNVLFTHFNKKIKR